MTVAKFTQPDFTTQSPTNLKNNLESAIKVVAEIAANFAPHAADTPNMTVVVDAGKLWTGSVYTSKSQQATSTITAPSTNPRIDRVCLDTAGGVTVVAGSEAASPSAPDIPVGYYPLCQFQLEASTTAITNSMLTDERPIVNVIPGLPHESVLINGTFDVWQRGNSFVGITVAYTADRWRADAALGNADVTRQAFALGQTVVPGEPRYHLRYQQTVTSGTNPTLQHRIEHVQRWEGMFVISAWLKADVAISVAVSLIQHFGSGGTPSPDVATSAPSWNVGTTWQRFTAVITVPSTAGKTLGTNGDDYLALYLGLPTNSFYTLDLAQVSLCPGQIPASPPKRLSAAELALCQRYYLTGATGLSGYSNASYPHQVAFQFPQRMRAAPTITTLLSGSSGMAGSVAYSNIKEDSANWVRSKDGAAGMFFQNILYAAAAEL